MLNKILSTASVAGRTQNMTDLLREELSNLFDTNTIDDLGSLYFTRKLGDGKKLMISCAVDTAGLIATYTDGTKINVSSIGGFNIANLAFSKVNFDKAEGVLVPLGGFEWGTPITDYAVETGNEEAVKEVTDAKTFRKKMSILVNGLSADSHTGVGVGAAEQVHNIQLLGAGQLLQSQFLTGLPSLNGSRLVIVSELLGGPPNGVLGGLIHNDELVFGGTAGVDTGHNVDGAQLSQLTLVIAFQGGIHLSLEQLLVRRVVDDLGSTGDAILFKVDLHVFFLLNDMWQDHLFQICWQRL